MNIIYPKIYGQANQEQMIQQLTFGKCKNIYKRYFKKNNDLN